MAVWIKTTTGSETVTPANGKAFKVAELQAMVGGYIEAVRLSDDLIMWVNEEGKLKGLPLNAEATRMAATFKMGAATLWNDHIVGDVVVANMTESDEDDEEDFGDWADNDTDREAER